MWFTVAYDIFHTCKRFVATVATSIVTIVSCDLGFKPWFHRDMCVCMCVLAANSCFHISHRNLHWQNWPIIHPTIHPFIHPTIHAIRPLSRLQVQNSRQRCPHLLLPSHLLQHFWGDTNVLSKPRNLISAACAGSALRTFSWWDVWKRRASFQNCLWIS